MSERVRISSEGPLAYLTLTRPDKHNGLTIDMLNALVRYAQGVA